MGIIYYNEFTDEEKSKHLTTGQMIDKINYGEIAIGVDGFYEGSKLSKTLRFGLRYIDLNDLSRTDEAFSITDSTFGAMWKIEPHPLMTSNTCINCKFIEMYSDTCPVDDDDDTEHLDDGFMVSCKCFKNLD